MENLPTYRLTQSGPEAQEILDQVNLNTADIEQLKRLYQALTQSEPEIIEPTDTWPVANPEENVIYRVIDRVNTPPQYYTDYMWNGTSMVLMSQYNNAIDNEPTANSNNLVKSGGVYSFVHANGGAYDISAAHAVGGVLATYDDLADALGTNGANVPAAVRKGGMSIKFVLSSDNKYVQYRYMGTAVTGTPNPFLNEANWQGVDDEPTEGSNNLVKSGGVYSINEKMLIKLYAMTSNAGSIPTGSIYYNTSTKLLRLSKGGGMFRTIPFADGAIYQYQNRLYTWNGTDLVDTYNSRLNLLEFYSNVQNSPVSSAVFLNDIIVYADIDVALGEKILIDYGGWSTINNRLFFRFIRTNADGTGKTYYTIPIKNYNSKQDAIDDTSIVVIDSVVSGARFVFIVNTSVYVGNDIYYNRFIIPYPTSYYTPAIVSDVQNLKMLEGNYDISANHSGATYADLATALGTNGVNVPTAVRKGGMGVRFINSDGKYMQWRYIGTSITDADFVNVANWQNSVEQMGIDCRESLLISDENGKILVKFEDGNIKTKHFNSKNTTIIKDLDSLTPFLIADNQENYIFIIKDNGHIKTKSFDSRLLCSSFNSFLDNNRGGSSNITGVASDTDIKINTTLNHILEESPYSDIILVSNFYAYPTIERNKKRRAYRDELRAFADYYGLGHIDLSGLGIMRPTTVGVGIYTIDLTHAYTEAGAKKIYLYILGYLIHRYGDLSELENKKILILGDSSCIEYPGQGYTTWSIKLKEKLGSENVTIKAIGGSGWLYNSQGNIGSNTVENQFDESLPTIYDIIIITSGGNELDRFNLDYQYTLKYLLN